MDENYIERIISELTQDLFPNNDEKMSHELLSYEKLIFSEIFRIKITCENFSKNIIVKRYLKEKREDGDQSLSVLREFNILKKLHENFSSLGSINVIKPLYVSTNENFLVTEEFEGKKLSTIINDDIKWIRSFKSIQRARSYCSHVGIWLRQFQKFTKKSYTTSFSRKSFIKTIEDRLSSIKVFDLKKELHKNIYLYINNIFDRIGDQKLEIVGYHSDFTPGNILALDNEIRVMDFDRFSYRNRYEDLSRFLSALEGKKSIVGMIPKNIDELKEAFLQGYGIEEIHYDILNLFLLKNTLKTLNMIDVFQDLNAKTIDKVYERYRKRKQINLYARYIGKLINND